MKRVAMLGGTFDPIHMGHLALAESALKDFSLDKLLWVPVRTPPHKNSKNILSADLRLEMLTLAIQGYDMFEACDFELKQEGPSYSILTVEYIKKIYPEALLFLIVGQDWVLGLSQWKNFDRLSKLVTFIVSNRGGYKKMETSLDIQNIKIPDLNISSSDIRKRLTRGESVEGMLPPRVLNFIQKKKLYQQ